jgi:hypothetical protein
METKINIAEILKDKLENTKLYSPLFGDVDFYYVGNDLIKVKHHGGRIVTLFDNGRYYNYPESELLLFPSKEMKDWSKFAWKKGDVLINSCGFQCIFKEWASDDYTKFNGCYSCSRDGYEDVSNAETAKFAKLDHNIAYGYVREIERKLGGKLNLETLEIERQPEFKDGDIVMSDSGTIVLVRGISLTRKIYYHAYMRNEYIYINQVEGEFFSRVSRIKRFATDSEKQQLFDALAKEGKAWDAEKKQIVDLKPKCEFKPFDRCIWKIRNCEGSIWQASFVSYVDKYGATPMGMSIDEDLVNLIILPYNDQTKLLVGTTDEWKGGEQ